MLGAVELGDGAMQVDSSSADDASDFSVLYDMADQAVFGDFSPNRADGTYDNVFCSCSSPPPPPPPPVSTGIDCTPTAPPKYAGDALLTTSGQDLHTELVLSRVVGGAVRVKIKSWQTRVVLKAAAEQDIERNMLALVKLCDCRGSTSSSI